MINENEPTDDDASPQVDFVPFKAGHARHATLTAVAVAEEQLGEPVGTTEIIEAANELGISDDYTETTVKRRLTTLYGQGFLSREDGRSFEYSVSPDGRDELDEHGHYEVDR